MSLDPEKLLFIFVIAVLVLGPERLPQMARTMGRVLAEVRKYTSGFQSEVGKVLAEPRAIIDAAVREADIRPDIRRAANNGAETPGTNGASSNGSASGNGSDTADGWASAGFAAEDDETEPPGPGSSAAAPGGYSGNGAAAAARAQRGRADLSPQTAEGAPDDPALN